MRRVSAAEARAELHAGGEIAFLDLREAGEFGEGHPLFAVPLPYSRLEARIGALVPRPDVTVILIDGGDGVAERGADRLAALGYDRIGVVAGGIGGWEEAGFPVYKGVNVPSKTLGELAEALWHPAMIAARDLASWRQRGGAPAVFDARPPAEYARMRVPGSRCLPNGELAHRLPRAAAEGPIVVTCAGRTRGIIGAIGLRLAGHEGPVHVLENGTQGWALAGLVLERGNQAEPYPALDEAALAQSRARAEALSARYGIARIGPEDVASLLAEPGRTTYLFDLRSEEEAALDPLPAAPQVPGGQLVQATDQWVGVRRARIVLADEGGLRAAIAAFWLKQLGHEPVLVRIDDALRGLPPPARRGPARIASPVGARAARAAVAAGALLLDLRPSMTYRRGHVAGAVWGIRPRLAALAPLGGRDVVIVAESREVADPAALDLAEGGAGRILLVEGGHEALVAAGAPVEASPGRPADGEAIDHLFFVHDRHDGNLEASRRYLEWETGLVGQLDEVERAEFRLIGPG